MENMNRQLKDTKYLRKVSRLKEIKANNQKKKKIKGNRIYTRKQKHQKKYISLTLREMYKCHKKTAIFWMLKCFPEVQC
jgi:DNA-directed RNA polymerase subunit M/transcription elongation factor TFIIS